MAWTQTDLDNLRAAAASGVRKVSFADGRSTEYQNADMILAAIKVVEADLAGVANGRQSRRRATVLRVGCRR